MDFVFADAVMSVDLYSNAVCESWIVLQGFIRIFIVLLIFLICIITTYLCTAYQASSTWGEGARRSFG